MVKKITLSWEPATQDDVAIIEAYGSLFEVPAYLVKVRPVLKIDGKVAASGQAIGLGHRQQFVTTLHSAGKSVERTTNPVTAGAFYSIGLNYQSISKAELEKIEASMQEAKAFATKENLYTDEVMGELLNGIVKAYFAQVDLITKMNAEVFNVNTTLYQKKAMTGYNVQVKYLFFSPVEISPAGLFIDVDHNVRSVVSRGPADGTEDIENATDNTAEFMFATGVIGSALEHIIFEQISGIPSVSTIKILDEANSRGIPIHSITKSNIDEVLPLLKHNSTVKQDIKNAINQGRTVTIPEEEVRYYD
jgi:hypothetical protein